MSIVYPEHLTRFINIYHQLGEILKQVELEQINIADAMDQIEEIGATLDSVIGFDAKPLVKTVENEMRYAYQIRQTGIF